MLRRYGKPGERRFAPRNFLRIAVHHHPEFVTERPPAPPSAAPTCPRSPWGELRLSRNVRQPKHVLANEIAGHKAERRPGAGEEGRAATKHEGAEVQSVLVNQAKVGQALCQAWSGNRNLPGELRLQPANRWLNVTLDECGV